MQRYAPKIQRRLRPRLRPTNDSWRADETYIRVKGKWVFLPGGRLHRGDGRASTVPEKIAQLQRQYGLKEIIFVGDRGMITKTVADKIKGIEGLHTISVLTHRQMVELLERKVITAELFDEEQIVEVY